MLGITVSAALWGTVLGSLLAGPPSDRYGRRGCLSALGALYMTSALGCAFAWSWSALLVFRVAGGLAIGGSSVIAPMYIAEISPALRRGRLVSLFQVNIVTGILLAYLSNYLISQAGFGPAEWRWKLGITALPAAVFFATLFGIPQSPRWLVAAGRNEEARDVLRETGESDPDREVRRSMRDMAIRVKTRLVNPMATACISPDSRLGRKKLLLTGAAGTAFCLAGVAGLFATDSHPGWLVWLLIGFIAFFAFSQGAVIWVYLSEVFPNLVRAKGQSLGSFSHRIMNALISGVFPVMVARSGALPFYSSR